MAERPADINYTFSEGQLAALAAYGAPRRHAEGEVLVEEGDRRADCLVTLSGEIHMFIAEAAGVRRLGWMERGQFPGGVAVMTGAASIARVVMGKPGEVLHIPFERLQRLLVENAELSDVFVRTFTARSAFARMDAHSAIVLIGPPYDRDLFALRDFLGRHGLAHTWLDPDVFETARPIMAARGIGATDLPAVVLGTSRVLAHPTVNDLARELGLDLLRDGATADVVVVGAGPAGLAASVYCGSEGLSVLALDADGPGGQAGTSSKIENYLGFPTGISGRELAERAAIQAQKFGVRMASPAAVGGLEPLAGGDYCLHLRDGRRLAARAVVIATGAQYRRLPIPGIAEFEGRGVYYGASPVEAQLCTGSRVAVVGAGNSAGQGAVFLARAAREVHVLYRRRDIRATMSDYLVRRLEEAPNVHLHPEGGVAAIHGALCADARGPRLVGVTVRGPEGERPLDTPFVFLFIGAAPCTEWLPPEVARDAGGFVRTGPALATLDLVRAGWRLDRLPTYHETSLPRVYAVGDVRAGSVKRVASAVGEGSVVVSDIHRALTAPDRSE